MEKITLEAYAVAKETHRNKVGVADKLKKFLSENIKGLAKGQAYKITSQDFLGTSDDFHYYQASKMLAKDFANKLEWSFALKEKARCNTILIKVK